MEIAQKAIAAVGSSADAQTAQHLGLVPDADLAQLDAGVENAGQIPHQRPEIDPTFGGEEEQDLAAVEVVLHLDQLHVQPMLLDFLLADLVGSGLLLLVLLHGGEIGVGGHAQHRAQGGHQLHLVNEPVALDALAELHAPARLDNDPVAHGDGHAIWVEIV